jgi:hypothetical protein
MKRGDWKIKAGAIALALIGVLFAVSGVASLWPHWSVASLLIIAFGSFSLFVAARSYWKASRPIK